jgi:hypothetical protein
MVAQPPPVCGPEARAASLPLRLRQSPHIYRNGVGIEDDIPVIGAVEMQEGLDIFPPACSLGSGHPGRCGIG